MICNDRGDARREWTLTPDAVFVAKEGFEVHSALYGDGKIRYADVTKIVQSWVPNWPENWREVLYAERKPQSVSMVSGLFGDTGRDIVGGDGTAGLVIHSARYGILGAPMPFRDHSIDVAARVRELVKDDALDIIVNNSTLAPSQNPYRGKKKVLLLTYSYDGGEQVTIERVEKEALIIGRPQGREAPSVIYDGNTFTGKPEFVTGLTVNPVRREQSPVLAVLKEMDVVAVQHTKSATALNDFLIRRFNISAYRLRAPMPIELPNFHRNDLAQLFAELGFKRGAEIGVAEGNYSEVLLKANPDCELLLVDPWHAYSDNPQNKSKEKHEFAYNEMKRKVKPYMHATAAVKNSMEAVRKVDEGSLDFVYIDGNHSFDYVMQDLIEWSKRVRSGGIVTGDDFIKLDEKRWGAGPVEAVTAYVNAHRIPIWYVFQGHKSVDYLWVRP